MTRKCTLQTFSPPLNLRYHILFVVSCNVFYNACLEGFSALAATCCNASCATRWREGRWQSFGNRAKDSLLRWTIEIEGHFRESFFLVKNHHIGFVPQGDRANKIFRHNSMCQLYQLSEIELMTSKKLWSIHPHILLTKHFHVEGMGTYKESRFALLSKVQVGCNCLYI